MKISIRAYKDILILKLDGEKTFQEQKEDVERYLMNMKSFLSNGESKFTYEGCELTFEEEIELCNLADVAFDRDVEFVHKKRPPEWLMRHITANGERLVKKVIGTVLGGESIVSHGDVVIVGDVSPTAQVTANGDIYVIGNLRGIAHAGCDGNENAMIYAMNMNPVMLKIADKIGFNQNSSKDNQNGVAVLENGEIKVNLM